MILVDTSFWVDHFRRGHAVLERLLETRQVWLHPFVFGQLICGNLHSRRSTIARLVELRPAPVVPQGLVTRLIEHHRLYGTGLGWTDAQLLATALLHQKPLLTSDGALSLAADRLGVIYS